MTKGEFYLQYLKDEGYKPTLDSDGDVLFKYEGGTYYIIANENDPMFFHVFYPNFWTIDKPEDLEKAYRAANEASRQTKVGKVYVNEAKNRVSAAVEVYLKELGDGQHFLTRSIAAIRHAVTEFVKVMNA
jgi:hypothetical protein